MTTRDKDSSSSSAPPLAARLVEPPRWSIELGMADFNDSGVEDEPCLAISREDEGEWVRWKDVVEVLQAGRLVDPSPPQKVHEEVESRMDTKAEPIDSLTAATARADAHAERYRYEPDAMAIVQAVRRDLWPEMDSNDGGELLSWILNLCVKIQREQAARVDPSPLAQLSENKDVEARVDKGVNRHGQDLPQPPFEVTSDADYAARLARDSLRR